jgi:hypothetical protein
MLNSFFEGRRPALLPLLMLVFPLTCFAETKNIIDGIKLVSTKEKSFRTFRADFTLTIQASLPRVSEAITNFPQKCNNEMRSQRKWTPRESDCLYHNGNLVETVIHKELQPFQPEPNETDRFLLARHGNNRGAFEYLELVKIFEYYDGAKRLVREIHQDMLSDDEAKKLSSLKIKNNSVFQKLQGRFKLVRLGEQETEVNYQYTTVSDHWLLNKEMMIGQVFESMARGMADLRQSIIKATELPKLQAAPPP